METGGGELHEVIGILGTLAAREGAPARVPSSNGDGREELERRLLAAMRANAEALSRLSAAADRPDGVPPPEEKARALVEGGVVGLVGGLDRSLPRLEDELRRLGPSLRAVAVPLGAGLVEGLAAELSARGPQLAKATARLVGELAIELTGQLLQLGRGVFGREAPPHVRRPALLAAGATAALALGAAAAFRQVRRA